MRLLLVAALLFGFLAAGVVPADAQASWCKYFDFRVSSYGWSAYSDRASYVPGLGWSAGPFQSRRSVEVAFGQAVYITDVRVFRTVAISGHGAAQLYQVPSYDLIGGTTYYNQWNSSHYVGGTLWGVHIEDSSSQYYDGPVVGGYIYVVIVTGSGANPFVGVPDCVSLTPTFTASPTSTFTPSPSPTPLLGWLPTTDYRPVCTVVAYWNLTETAVAPSPFPSLVVPTMQVSTFEVPTLHVPTMVLPGAPTLTPSLSPTASETPLPTFALPATIPTNTRTPTPTLDCRVPDPTVPLLVDVSGLVPERDPQCFRMIPLIDWHIDPINLLVFTTPPVDVHVPEVQFCVTWLPLRLSILGMDFTGLLAVGLALLGARFIMGFRKEI